MLVVFSSKVLAKSTLDLGVAGVSAKAMGLGKAYVGVLEGSESVFLNPAGMAYAKSWGVTSMSTKLLNRVDYKMLGGVYPTKNGVFGIGYIGANTPAGFATTNKGSLTGAKAISYGSNLLVLSYGKKLSSGSMKDAAFGINAKVLSNSFQGTAGSATGVDLDAAVMFKPKKGLKVGAVLTNFLPADMGGSLNWDSGTKEQIPTLLKIGGSYLVRPNIMIAGDIDLDASGKQPVTLHTGVEWKPIKHIALRAGLDQNALNKAATVTDLAFGVGVNFKGFSFDYAYKNNSLVENNNAHYFSFSFAAENFNAKEKKSLVEMAKKKNTETIKTARKHTAYGETFETEKEKNEYMYLVATGRIKAGKVLAKKKTNDKKVAVR